MIGYILVALFFWVIKLYPDKVKTEEKQREWAVIKFFIYPFIVLALAFVWNFWAHRLINWPQITNFKELVLAIVIF